MKKTIFLASLGVVGVLLLFFVTALFSFRTKAVNLEETIKAQYTQNQNSYDNLWKKFKEISQVTDRYASDLKELYANAMTGRYGEDGSRAMFQWLHEQNPTLSSETYVKLQSVVEAGRNSFESDQKQLIAKKEQYAKLLRSNSALVLNVILGFPKINLDEYSIVTSGQTENVFKEKKADEINLFE